MTGKTQTQRWDSKCNCSWWRGDASPPPALCDWGLAMSVTVVLHSSLLSDSETTASSSSVPALSGGGSVRADEPSPPLLMCCRLLKRQTSPFRCEAEAVGCSTFTSGPNTEGITASGSDSVPQPVSNQKNRPLGSDAECSSFREQMSHDQACWCGCDTPDHLVG